MSEKIASLFAEIGADTSPLDTALGESTAALGGLVNTLGGAGAATDAFSDSATEAADGLEELGEEVENVGNKIKESEGKQDSFKQQMRGLNDAIAPVNMALGIYSQVLDTVREGAERLGRSELPDALDRAQAAGQRLADSFLEVEFSMFGLEKRDAISWFTDAADGATQLANAVSNADIFVTAFTGAELTGEQQSRLLAISYQEVALTTEQLAQAQLDMADPLDESNRLLNDHADAALAAQAAEAAANAEADRASGIYGAAATALANSNIPLQQKIDLQNQLAIAAGLTTQEELDQQEAIGFLTKQLELGNITLDEYKARLDALASGAATATQTINATSAAIAAIPNRTVHIDYVENFGGAGDPNASATSGPPDDGNTQYGGAQASGGSYIVSTPTWFMAGENGPERAQFTPLNQSNPESSDGGLAALLTELTGLLRGLPASIGRSVRDNMLMGVK